MPLPKSLTQPFRQGQLVVGSGYRSYWAPFNLQAAVSQTSSVIGPTIYDLQQLGRFIDTPTLLPPGWFDLGFIDKVKFTNGSKIGNVISGYRGAVRAKYRAEVGEKISLVFREMGHMQMKIATGNQTFNLLKTNGTQSVLGPVSASGIAAVPMGASGYVATGLGSGPTNGLPTLFVPAGSGAAFAAGTYIVCDQDYTGGSGFVGDAGANVFPGAVSDIDFIRKTSDYISGVRQVVPSAVSGQDALILTGPFVGGGNAPFGAVPNTVPTSGAKVQAIQGFAQREGGTYIKEWSAIFVLDTIDASQILYYYPRLAPDVFSGWDPENLQNANSEQTYSMNTSLEAVAFDDPEDGETVTSYKAYYPTSGLNIQI